MSGDYILCGWRVRSALAMPELLPWQGDARSADVEISLGDIPERTDKPIFVRPHSRLWADSAFLLELDGLGRFWVEGGKRVLVEPATDANEAELRGFILGSVLGALCHQRGLLPVHASAVRIAGRAVLFTGISGAGKSTLSAAMGARGHALVADDVVAFDPVSSMVLPAFPQRKLPFDSMEALNLDHVGLIPNRPGQPKFRIPVTADFDSTPLSPSAIYLLSTALPGKTGSFKPLPKALAMHQIDKMIYRGGIGRHIQTPNTLFQAVGKLVQSAPVFVLPLEPGRPLALLDQLASRVASHVSSLRDS